MEWDPSRFFRVSGSPSPYALLILNQPINENAFGVLSQYGESLHGNPSDNQSVQRRYADPISASYIVCADGGANRLYDMMKLNGTESNDVRFIYSIKSTLRYLRTGNSLGKIYPNRNSSTAPPSQDINLTRGYSHPTP